MTDRETVRVDERGGVLTLTLDRPEARNAINWAMRRTLDTHLRRAAADTSVRVVVLRGDDRAFCAGGDLKEMGAGTGDDLAKLALAKRIVVTIAEMPQPVVAVVRGHAAGAGFSLAAACDLVVADETARFTAPFVRRGLVPDMGATFWLVRQLGPHRARDVLLTGRALIAEEAAELGLVARLWPAAELEDRLTQLLDDLVGTPPVALELTKALLLRAGDAALPAGLEAERLAQAIAADVTAEADGHAVATNQGSDEQERRAP